MRSLFTFNNKFRIEKENNIGHIAMSEDDT